jgi:3-hydroxyisobutyrate dehydrogenase-like beta-hydroxyacid dehydrogenase
MANNVMLALAMAAFSEAAVLGLSLGIPKGLLFDTLLNSPVAAPFLAFKRPKIEEGAFDADFPLRFMRKDLQLASDTAYETGVPLPLANAAKELYALAVKDGLGDRDFSAIYKMISG